MKTTPRRRGPRGKTVRFEMGLKEEQREQNIALRFLKLILHGPLRFPSIWIKYERRDD